MCCLLCGEGGFGGFGGGLCELECGLCGVFVFGEDDFCGVCLIGDGLYCVLGCECLCDDFVGVCGYLFVGVLL